MDSVAEVASSEHGVNGCFDCNICLEPAFEPVVSLCGHLYCWPCIYKWIHHEVQRAPREEPKCPVCNAYNISSNSLIPIYGAGAGKSSPEYQTMRNKREVDRVVPNRPAIRQPSPEAYYSILNDLKQQNEILRRHLGEDRRITRLQCESQGMDVSCLDQFYCVPEIPFSFRNIGQLGGGPQVVDPEDFSDLAELFQQTDEEDIA